MHFCCCCSFGNKHVTPRTLTSRYLGNMVCVEGIVTKSKETTYLLQNLCGMNTVAGWSII